MLSINSATISTNETNKFQCSIREQPKIESDFIYLWTKRVYFFIRKSLWIKRRRIRMNYPPQKTGALLCALSVGAAIVIARPNDEPKQLDTIEQQSILEQTNAVNTGSASIWGKTKAEVKQFAQKSFDFGKRITFKTANVSTNFVGNVSDSLTTIIQWRRKKK